MFSDPDEIPNPKTLKNLNLKKNLKPINYMRQKVVLRNFKQVFWEIHKEKILKFSKKGEGAF